MKLSDAIIRGKAGDWIDVQVRTNPANRQQWFVTLESRDYKSYILVDDDERPVTNADLDSIAQLIESMGVKQFTVYC